MRERERQRNIFFFFSSLQLLCKHHQEKEKNGTSLLHSFELSPSFSSSWGSFFLVVLLNSFEDDDDDDAHLDFSSKTGMDIRLRGGGEDLQAVREGSSLSCCSFGVCVCAAIVAVISSYTLWTRRAQRG